MASAARIRPRPRLPCRDGATDCRARSGTEPAGRQKAKAPAAPSATGPRVLVVEDNATSAPRRTIRASSSGSPPRSPTAGSGPLPWYRRSTRGCVSPRPMDSGTEKVGEGQAGTDASLLVPLAAMARTPRWWGIAVAAFAAHVRRKGRRDRGAVAVRRDRAATGRAVQATEHGLHGPPRRTVSWLLRHSASSFECLQNVQLHNRRQSESGVASGGPRRISTFARWTGRHFGRNGRVTLSLLARQIVAGRTEWSPAAPARPGLVTRGGIRPRPGSSQPCLALAPRAARSCATVEIPGR
jgi:hypothetical protein